MINICARCIYIHDYILYMHTHNPMDEKQLYKSNLDETRFVFSADLATFSSEPKG